MGTYSPILNMPLVQVNQTQKELTINTALAILEQAGNSQISYSGAGGNITPTQDEWTKNIYHIVTGATAAINFTIPATPRMFVINNAGTTQPITVGCVGAATGSATLTVPFGKIMLAITDGTNVVALSSGVGRLQDLSDVVTAGVTNGQVLAYQTSTGKWVPVTIASGGASAFTQLSDAPNNYAGAAGFLVQVNAGDNGLQFVDPKSLTRYTPDEITAAYTLALTDENHLKQVNSIQPVTITVDADATVDFQLGASVSFLQASSGQATIAPASGVTLLFPSDMAPATRLQNSVISITKVAANTWTVVGDMAA